MAGCIVDRVLPTLALVPVLSVVVLISSRCPTQVRASSVPDTMQRLLARKNCFASPHPPDKSTGKQPPPPKLLGAVDILQVRQKECSGNVPLQGCPARKAGLQAAAAAGKIFWVLLTFIPLPTC